VCEGWGGWGVTMGGGVWGVWGCVGSCLDDAHQPTKQNNPPDIPKLTAPPPSPPTPPPTPPPHPPPGFGQEPGTFHLRTTILPREEKMLEFVDKFR